MGWFWFAYYVGGMITMRHWILDLQKKAEIRSGGARRWHQQREAVLMILGVWIWPIVAILYFSWKLMFPHGVQTKQSRRLNQARLQAAVESRRALMTIYAEALVQSPTDNDAAMRYAVAEREFNEACAKVWATRGLPWSIGRLASVRTRRAKAATQ